jgi:hypothetical protein
MTDLRCPSFNVRLPLVAMAAGAIAILAGWPAFAAEPIPPSNGLQKILNQSVESTLAKFASSNLRSNQLAVTLVDLRRTNPLSRASYRGDVQIYPASVIKLFYLAAAHSWMEDGKLEDTAELRRAMKDMIVESYNEATHYVVDLLTGTTSGPELPDAELDVWFEKRNAVNRYFVALGYANVVANKKPWCEGPYGRESQSIKRQKPNRNMLSTDDTARLLVEIVNGQCVSARRCHEMLELLKRDPYKPLEEGGEPDQGNAFTGLALRERPGAKLWSKAGWTSQVRHDAAFVELPDGGRFVLVTFTEGHSKERGIIEAMGRAIVREFSAPRE